MFVLLFFVWCVCCTWLPAWNSPSDLALGFLELRGEFCLRALCVLGFNWLIGLFFLGGWLIPLLDFDEVEVVVFVVVVVLVVLLESFKREPEEAHATSDSGSVFLVGERVEGEEVEVVLV